MTAGARAQPVVFDTTQKKVYIGDMDDHQPLSWPEYQEGVESSLVTANTNSVTGGIGLSVGDIRIAQAVKRAMLSAFDTQRSEDAAYGPMLLARTGYPLAADIPTITGIVGNPSGDADAAAQVIYPLGTLGATDPIPLANMTTRRYYKGFNPNLYGRIWGDGMRLAETVTQYGSNGSQDQDTYLVPGQSWGIDSALVIFDGILDGDVLFGNIQANQGLEIYVNGSLVTSAAGTGATLNGSRNYSISAHGYIKIKFGSVARRRIKIIAVGTQVPQTLHIRNTATLTPVSDNAIQWLHFGDSFSQYAGATAQTIALTSWMHAAFGLSCDFINMGQGGTGFANGGTKPGETPTNGVKPSIRNQYVLAGQRNLNPQVVSMLIGHNDVLSSMPSVKSELTLMLQDIRARYPDALVFVFGSNASPGNIADNSSLTVEAAIREACAEVAGVAFFPMQSWSAGKFLRGTGRVGATTGDGNCDLYTGTDAVHPSDAGHRAHGQMMAERIAEWLRANI